MQPGFPFEFCCTQCHMHASRAASSLQSLAIFLRVLQIVFLPRQKLTSTLLSGRWYTVVLVLVVVISCYLTGFMLTIIMFRTRIFEILVQDSTLVPKGTIFGPTFVQLLRYLDCLIDNPSEFLCQFLT